MKLKIIKFFTFIALLVVLFFLIDFLYSSLENYCVNHNIVFVPKEIKLLDNENHYSITGFPVRYYYNNNSNFCLDGVCAMLPYALPQSPHWARLIDTILFLFIIITFPVILTIVSYKRIFRDRNL